MAHFPCMLWRRQVFIFVFFGLNNFLTKLYFPGSPQSTSAKTLIACSTHHVTAVISRVGMRGRANFREFQWQKRRGKKSNKPPTGIRTSSERERSVFSNPCPKTASTFLLPIPSDITFNFMDIRNRLILSTEQDHTQPNPFAVPKPLSSRHFQIDGKPQTRPRRLKTRGLIPPTTHCLLRLYLAPTTPCSDHEPLPRSLWPQAVSSRDTSPPSRHPRPRF